MITSQLQDATTPAAWVQPARGVLVCILGSFTVLNARAQMLLRGGRKAELLLGNLALYGQSGVSRDRLLDVLWPDTDAAQASQSLNSLIYNLHRQLGPALDGAPPVIQAGGVYRLNAEAGVEVDLARFDALASIGDRDRRESLACEPPHAYEAAVRMYRGDLSAGSDVQALIERERVRARYLNMLSHLGEYWFEQHDYSECMEYVLRLLSADPSRENGHRLAMRCFVRRGERAQALRQFRVCEAILRSEFDAQPEAATRALFDSIRLDPDSV